MTAPTLTAGQQAAQTRREQMLYQWAYVRSCAGWLINKPQPTKYFSNDARYRAAVAEAEAERLIDDLQREDGLLYDQLAELKREAVDYQERAQRAEAQLDRIREALA